MAKIFTGLIAIVACFALVLQFGLMMTSADSQSVAVAERIVRFFSYFTILSNIIVAITATAIAFFPNTKLGTFFTRPNVQAAVAVYISIVGIVYSLFLRSVWDPEGWQLVADRLLHDAVPIAFVVYWLLFAPKIVLKWLDPLKWLIFPLVYMLYSLTRGAIANWYPYYFVNVTQLGYSAVLTNAALILVAFVVVGIFFTAIGKLLSRPAN